MTKTTAATARLLRITSVCAWHALRLGGRLGLAALRGQARARRGTLLGQELRALCERLGATFIKLGQILSSRPDLLSHAVTERLESLQDAVTPFEDPRLPARLEAEFGRPPEEIFERFDPIPIAAASVANVYRARLADGREVAVKVRRPGIVEQVEGDLGLLRAVARRLARLPGMRAVPMVELADELAAPLRQQLDLRQELENLLAFRESFAGVEHVTLPVPVEALCTEGVLTMEMLEGLQKVTDAAAGRFQGAFTVAERRTAALAGLRALYRMIFLDGLVHADMHPGNVFLRPWGEVVLLDMGLVARLDDGVRQDFVDFFYGLVNDQGALCARIVWDNALYRSPRCDRAAFEAAITALVAEHSALESRDFEVTRFVFQLIETQRRFGIRGSTAFIMTVLAMVVYDGICKQLYPECDFQAEARPFLITARYRRRAA